MSTAPVLFWFRHDLRLSDNRALSAACESGQPVLPVYVLDDKTPGVWRMGEASRWWLHNSLAALARDLVNQPANYLTPAILAEKAQLVAKEKKLKCEIFDLARLQEEKFGAMLGVSQGSLEEPRFVILEYGFEEADKKDTLVLVGKGITFDSGGLSLKSSSGMETMKDDMAGAAAVLGVMQAIGEFKPDLHVVGLIAASENMPSGTAQRPGAVSYTHLRAHET